MHDVVFNAVHEYYFRVANRGMYNYTVDWIAALGILSDRVFDTPRWDLHGEDSISFHCSNEKIINSKLRNTAKHVKIAVKSPLVFGSCN